MSNIVEAIPRVGTIFRTKPVYQYDAGQIIHLSGITLPASYKAEFSNSTRSDAVTTVQTGAYVAIPASMLQSGNPVYVWIVTVDENSRTTEYEINVPVTPRSKPSDMTPTPEEQIAIDQLIVSVSALVADIQTIEASIVQATVAETKAFLGIA